jgi:phosphoglycolate phosphatase-like HAD superfamily hydrolase
MAEKLLPLQRRDRPGLTPEFPHRSPVCGGSLPSAIVAGLAIAVDIDAVLADTRPVWDAWLEDASRRARVELALPADREAAAALLDAELGDWRPLLERFAADRAPLWFRPRAETNAVLRRLSASGNRIGAFTDAPSALAELALAHTGAARYVETIGSLAAVRAELGADAVVITSREALAELP